MDKMDLVLQGPYNKYAEEIVSEYLKLDFVDHVIISCWENDEVSIVDDRVKVVKSQDLDNPGLENRNRQIKSSLEGLKAAKTEFAAKLRSDQKITLDSMKLMYDFYQTHKEQELSFFNGSKPRNRICVAGIFRPFPFHPRDHIFWGNTQDLIDVFTIPYDDVSLVPDYTKYLRAEAYICMWYYAKFDPEIIKYISEHTKYLVDRAPNISEALLKSDYWGPKVFKPFPRIDFAWPKHELPKYHYDLTARVFGEYWDN